MKLIYKGIGACSGTVQGKVKIIKDITKAPKIEDNCILVMPFFTPIVIILISKAKGIITDFGGTTSHGAVIAREFNIPCIVGVSEATKNLKDDQFIQMDGEKGEIYEF